MHPSLILQPSLPREKWVGRNGKDEKLKRQLDLPAKVSSKLTERNVCVKIYILFNLHFCRTPTRSDHEVRLWSTHPRHLAQRLKAAHLTGTRPQTHTFSESSCQ